MEREKLHSSAIPEGRQPLKLPPNKLRYGPFFRTAGLRTALLGIAVAAVCSPVAADDVVRDAGKLMSVYTGRLEELAAWCDERGLVEQAETTRRWLCPQNPNKLYVTVLSGAVGRPELPADTPADVAEWQKQFNELRRDQANSLYGLSRRAIRVGRASLAFDLVMVAIHENPDHEAIRRLLGYQKYRGQWHTLYEIRRLRAGQVWHEKFGWILKAHVARYEQGERYRGSRWITAEDDARLHQDIHSGWAVETEHYTIRTNHSLEAGVRLGARLEQLYRVWKQLFVRYYATQAQVTAMFDGRARRIQLPRHSVVYFRNWQEYIQALKPAVANVEISLGVYIENTRQAYFFAGDDHDERTLFHEATHQLFHESRPVVRGVGQKANFWIIEGIAMYMESLHQEDGFHVLGGFDDLRMNAARYRLLKDDFYVPFSEFTSYSLTNMQSDPRIATLYSQAAGMTHFLIHYDEGRYRDALVAYLAAVYQGLHDPGALSRLSGTSYSELDRQYREFIEGRQM